MPDSALSHILPSITTHTHTHTHTHTRTHTHTHTQQKEHSSTRLLSGSERGHTVGHSAFHHKLLLWTAPGQYLLVGTSHAQSLPPDLSPTALHFPCLSLTCSNSLPNLTPPTLPILSTHTLQTKCPQLLGSTPSAFAEEPQRGWGSPLTRHQGGSSQAELCQEAQSHGECMGVRSQWAVGKTLLKTTMRCDSMPTRMPRFKVR